MELFTEMLSCMQLNVRAVCLVKCSIAFIRAVFVCVAVDDNEMFVIRKTWDDLAERNNGKGIDKDTFLQYFPLHGLLGGLAVAFWMPVEKVLCALMCCFRTIVCSV